MTETSKPQGIRSDQIVYVREADIDQLPETLRDGDSKVYALHDSAGKCLALATNRNAAFALARRNDMRPFSVH